MIRRLAGLLLSCCLVCACVSTPSRPGVDPGSTDPPAPPAPPVEVWLEVTSGPQKEAPRTEVAVRVKQGAESHRHLVDELPGGLDGCELDRDGDQTALRVSTSMGEDRWILEARHAAKASRLAVVVRTHSVFQGQPLVEQLDPVPLPAGVRVNLRPCSRLASR